MAATFGISRERLDAYADWHWGVRWRRNTQGCVCVLTELDHFRSDPQAMIDKIAAEIGEYLHGEVAASALSRLVL